ncbi:hypothetical protein NBCG_02963 [Nocardioidaceae bacterium Broad-1]|nr:hypothetical protein NBCG_02963 [Nocardioidaceae bacterium Broad-1]
MLTVGGGELYLPDLFMMAVLQRSYGLVDAFIDAVDHHNLHAAAPLLRVQIDSLFRLSYVCRAPSVDDVVRDVMAGVEFRQMKDVDGRKLSDGRLKDLAQPFHPWTKDVYDKASGWVHLSRSHMGAAWQVRDDVLTGGLPLRPGVVPERLWRELLAAMQRATREVLDYADGWSSRKGLPPDQYRDLHADGHPIVTVEGMHSPGHE